MKYKAHPSITTKESCFSKYNFNISLVEKLDIVKEIKMLQSNKASQNTDKVLTKLIKGNTDIFTNFFISLNKSIKQSAFPWKLKLANKTLTHKKS